MTILIALLRGINVGGKNILPMKELVRFFEDAGGEDVKTYIQSGNVVFTHSTGSTGELNERIATAIERSRDFRPAIVMLDLETLRDAAASNPFPEAAAEPKSLHLYFFEGTPDVAGLAALKKLKAASESYRTSGNTLFLHAPEGVGKSRLVKGIDKALGLNATGRNWRTITRLIELGSEITQ